MHYALCIVGSVHRPGDALRARLRGGSAAATASMSDVTIGLQVGEHGEQCVARTHTLAELKMAGLWMTVLFLSHCGPSPVKWHVIHQLRIYSFA